MNPILLLNGLCFFYLFYPEKSESFRREINAEYRKIYKIKYDILVNL